MILFELLNQSFKHQYSTCENKKIIWNETRKNQAGGKSNFCRKSFIILDPKAADTNLRKKAWPFSHLNGNALKWS